MHSQVQERVCLSTLGQIIALQRRRRVLDQAMVFRMLFDDGGYQRLQRSHLQTGAMLAPGLREYPSYFTTIVSQHCVTRTAPGSFHIVVFIQMGFQLSAVRAPAGMKFDADSSRTPTTGQRRLVNPHFSICIRTSPR